MQTNNKFNPLIALLIVVFLISACASPQKMVETGNYDAAINAAVRKMSGKK